MSTAPAPRPGPVPQAPGGAGTAAVVVAAILHLGIAVWPLSASGLLAPLWAIVLIGLGWLVGAAVLYRLWQRRSPLALLVPVATLALWWAFISFGDAVLGWTA